MDDNGAPPQALEVVRSSVAPPPEGSELARLIAEGRARPAKGDLLARFPLELDVRPGRPLSEILLEMRDEDER